MMELKYNMRGLYPEERDYVLKQIELIKDKVYPKLDIRFSMLKRDFNNISIDMCIEDENKGLELFQLLKEVRVPNIATEYDDYISLDFRDVPCVDMKLSFCKDFEDYNTDKGIMV